MGQIQMICKELLKMYWNKQTRDVLYDSKILCLRGPTGPELVENPLDIKELH